MSQSIHKILSESHVLSCMYQAFLSSFFIRKECPRLFFLICLIFIWQVSRPYVKRLALKLHINAWFKNLSGSIYFTLLCINLCEGKIKIDTTMCLTLTLHEHCCSDWCRQNLNWSEMISHVQFLWRIGHQTQIFFQEIPLYKPIKFLQSYLHLYNYVYKICDIPLYTYKVVNTRLTDHNSY